MENLDLTQNLKAGDKVYSTIHGEGSVKAIGTAQVAFAALINKISGKGT